MSKAMAAFADWSASIDAEITANGEREVTGREIFLAGFQAGVESRETDDATTPPLAWSTEPPTVPGLYLRIQPGCSAPYELDVRQDEIGLRRQPSWWLGPLPSWRDLGSPLPEPVEPQS